MVVPFFSTHLDAVLLAEGLGVRDGLRGGILTQVIQQADGVDLRVCGKDQVHDGGGVQGVGGAGHVLTAVKACSSGVGDGGVHHRDLGIFHSGQHGGGGGGGHSHDHVHAIGHQVGTDLVQVALVGLRVGVVISVVKGDALFLAQLVQTALHGCHDLVEGSMIHIVDNAHLEGLTGHGAGSGLGGSGCTGCWLEAEDAAPPQPVSASAETAEAAMAAFRKLRREIMFMFFIVVNSFPGAGGIKKTRSLCGTGLSKIKTTLSLCVIHKDRIGKIRFCGATLLALL